MEMAGSAAEFYNDGLEETQRQKVKRMPKRD